MSAADFELSQALNTTRRMPVLTAAVKDAGAADKAAKEFEAVFIGQMVSAMFEGVKRDGPFGGGYGETVFRSLMIEHYSKTIAEQGGFGLAGQVKREILRLQEVQQ